MVPAVVCDSLKLTVPLVLFILADHPNKLPLKSSVIAGFVL